MCNFKSKDDVAEEIYGLVKKIENLDRVQSSFMLCLRLVTGGRFLM